MGRLSTWKCDECGAIKREVNGWWMMNFSPDQKLIQIWPMPDGEFQAAPEDLALCGRACVQRKVAEFMGGPDRG